MANAFQVGLTRILSPVIKHCESPKAERYAKLVSLIVVGEILVYYADISPITAVAACLPPVYAGLVFGLKYYRQFENKPPVPPAIPIVV